MCKGHSRTCREPGDKDMNRIEKKSESPKSPSK